MKKKFLKTLRIVRESTKKIPLLAYITFSTIEYYNKKISEKYDRNSFEKTIHENCDNKPSNNESTIDIITIAFNNPTLIETQIDLIRKNVTDTFFYTVVDNSNNTDQSISIHNICHEKGVGYIRLPKNPWPQANLSHGVALNWVYHNFIKPRNSKYFGFIDHDIFPIEQTSIMEKFHNEKLLYGLKQERNYADKKIWYLWAGFCFFKTEHLPNKNVNFNPIVFSTPKYIVGLDTGGGNWKSVYSKMNMNSVYEAKQIVTDGVEKIDSWIHLGKASFKESSEIKKFIDKLKNN